ncbi:response regulator [Psychromarinibacter sp. C21-152]|uniref:Response regulator n=1 Tax=Psychromarinibacter sediminicola TaxID=3033385 RepID=A0AAE3T8L4_9RHOB|nr:response regulator [Psychromarinibacter sediminicola]MDF0600174.1 response regulator [Psychromarinibacter sediminicola]
MQTKTVLVVEDEILIAMDIEMTLTEAGYRVIGPCHNVAEAEDRLRTERPGAAVLDVNLGRDETSAALARRLQAEGVPVVFLTGYAGPDDGLPGTLGDIPRLGKPIDVPRLLDLLGTMGGG